MRWCMSLPPEALFGMASELALLQRLASAPHRRIGLLRHGGAFGFHPKHYDVSVKAGEAALLPAVRAADQSTMIVASATAAANRLRS